MRTATRIVLVRHAEARCNVDATWAGHDGCQGLTDEGRRQAERLRARLAGGLHAVDVVLTSEMRRSIETCEFAAPGRGSTARAVCGLCEMHPGDLDGRPRAAAVDRAAGDAFWAPLGGESLVAFHRRAVRALLEVARAHEGRFVLAFTHRGVIDASFRAFGRRPAEEVEVEHASLTEWVRPPDAAHWVLARSNDLGPL